MKFLVIEGLDGSGKSTQVSMLKNYLKSNNVDFEYLHFPVTDSPVFGELVARFLRGDSGPVDQVDPYLVALLFAGDRFNYAEKIREWRKMKKFVFLVVFLMFWFAIPSLIHAQEKNLQAYYEQMLLNDISASDVSHDYYLDNRDNGVELADNFLENATLINKEKRKIYAERETEDIACGRRGKYFEGPLHFFEKGRLFGFDCQDCRRGLEQTEPVGCEFVDYRFKTPRKKWFGYSTRDQRLYAQHKSYYNHCLWEY